MSLNLGRLALRQIARGFEHSSAEGFGQKKCPAVSDRKLTAFRRDSSHPCLAEPWPTPKSRFPPMPSSGHWPDNVISREDKATHDDVQAGNVPPYISHVFGDRSRFQTPLNMVIHIAGWTFSWQLRCTSWLSWTDETRLLTEDFASRQCSWSASSQSLQWFVRDRLWVCWTKRTRRSEWRPCFSLEPDDF